MINDELYGKAKQEAINKIRHQRDAHAPHDIENDLGLQSPFNQELFVFKDNNAKTYSWVMQQAEQNTLEMLKEIIKQLLNEHV